MTRVLAARRAEARARLDSAPDFAAFPPRMPRNTFSSETKAAIRQMVLQNHTGAEIRRANGVLCNKDVLYDAVRGARAEMRAAQARALRDAAAASGVWSSEIHLTEDSVFAEAFPSSHSSCFFRQFVFTLDVQVLRVCFIKRTSRANDVSDNNGQLRLVPHETRKKQASGPTKHSRF